MSGSGVLSRRRRSSPEAASSDLEDGDSVIGVAARLVQDDPCIMERNDARWCPAAASASARAATCAQLNAVFLTHIHSDHVAGFSDIAQTRWLFGSEAPKLDVICGFRAAR